MAHLLNIYKACRRRPQRQPNELIDLMLNNFRLFFYSSAVFLFAYTNSTLAMELQGHAGLEGRYFTEQSQSQLSAFGELELYWSASEAPISLTFKAFGRVDDTDEERSHSDIREFSWLYYQDTWELKAGVSKVFWGVTESAHRVDIINQTDAVESPDGEQKLGQPMIHLASIRSWGVLNAYVLPYFRERNFESIDGYLGPDIHIDQDHALYQSSQKEHHTDIALRYSHTLDIWDFGISYFQGTDREPLFQPNMANNALTLVPFYAQMQQAGIDIQATIDQWLWKLEAIYKDNDNKRNLLADNFDNHYTALTAGFEYTHVGLAGSAMDLGLLSEYHYNDQSASNARDPLQNDLFIGARLTLNDVQNSALLAGLIQDLDHSESYMAFIEASRRVQDNWVITLDARLFSSKPLNDPLAFLDRADHTTLQAAYYF